LATQTDTPAPTIPPAATDTRLPTRTRTPSRTPTVPVPTATFWWCDWNEWCLRSP
jgi:hypothetical protein